MQQTVAKLYANLIQFMVHAMHWYQKGRPRRALGAIFKPFALDFQDQLNEVNELSKSVDDIAVTAAQAELRAVHVKVEDAYSELTSVRMEIQQLGDLVLLEAARVFQVASCTINYHSS
jgi:DNA-binding ferritin-like protein